MIKECAEAIFAAAGADPVNANGSATGSAATGSGESYWTSSEKSDANAFYIRFGKFNSDGGSKTGTSRYARGMRVVTK